MSVPGTAQGLLLCLATARRQVLCTLVKFRHGRAMTPWRCILAFGICLLSSSPAATAAEDGQTFQDWIILCGEADEATTIEPCFMRQNVLLSEGQKRIMQVRVGIQKTDQRVVVIIIVPLGVSLPQGMALKVDQGEPVRLPYQRCTVGGCTARFVLWPKLEAAFKAGLTGLVTFEDVSRRSLTVPFSLKGFTDALNALR